MIRGRVTGRIWSTRHIDTLPNGALLVVTLEDGGSLIALGGMQDCPLSFSFAAIFRDSIAAIHAAR